MSYRRYKYSLNEAKTGDRDEILSKSNDDGPFVITIKTMSGDLIVLATGNGSDVKFDEKDDTLKNLYEMVSKRFVRTTDGRIVDKEKEEVKDDETDRRVNIYEILLLDADDENGDDLTISIFNYLKDRKRFSFEISGPGSFNISPYKFKSHKPMVRGGGGGGVSDTPLPKRNLNLNLLISDIKL